jgi:hypothetical protein
MAAASWSGRPLTKGLAARDNTGTGHILIPLFLWSLTHVVFGNAANAPAILELLQPYDKEPGFSSHKLWSLETGHMRPWETETKNSLQRHLLACLEGYA